MKKSLFNFLENENEDLYNLAKDMENSIYSDPHTAIIKGRIFAEKLSKIISDTEGCSELNNLTQVERIRELKNHGIIDIEIDLILHRIRTLGNKAAHDIVEDDLESAISMHRNLYKLACWYMESYIDYEFKAEKYEVPMPEVKENNSEAIDNLMNQVKDLINITKESSKTEENKEEKTSEETVIEKKEEIKKEVKEGEAVTLRFQNGTYHFYPEGAAERTYYISNHDQDNPKKVGLALEDMKSLTIEGNGAEFIFHGQMIPISLLRSTDCTLQNFSIDFANPHIAQVEIIKNEGEKGITFQPAPWVEYHLTKDSVFETKGEGWKLRPMSGIAFEKASRHIVYNTSDISCPTKGCSLVGKNLIYAPKWKDKRLPAGTIVAMRSWDRPTPGIFLSHNTRTTIKNVKVHYAQGMGLLAQLCDDITMDGFGVCLKGENDSRYFTT